LLRHIKRDFALPTPKLFALMIASQEQMQSRVALPGAPAASNVDITGEETTLIFRHVPRKYTKYDVVVALEQHVTRLDFNFVHVPWDRYSASNMGFAFVNFVNPATALKILAEMQGSLWPGDARLRPMKVMPSHAQGLTANLQKHMANVREPDRTHCPLILSEGEEVPIRTLLLQIEQIQQCDAQGHVPEGMMGIARGPFKSGPPGACTPPPPSPDVFADHRKLISEDFQSNASTGCTEQHPPESTGSAVATSSFLGSCLSSKSGFSAHGAEQPPKVLVHAAVQRSYARAWLEVDNLLQQLQEIYFVDNLPSSGCLARPSKVEKSANLHLGAALKQSNYVEASSQVTSLLDQLKRAGAF